MLSKVCDNCRWYVKARAGTHGFCKVDPPVYTYCDDTDRPRFYNPVVSAHNFCSRWANYREDE